MYTKATQIISIIKQKNRPSKYVLNVDGLQQLLDPIKNKEVALISIAGPSRQGKSFLLSYMTRYLSNLLDVNWIGEDDDPLIGFGWKTDLDPQTSGIWLSNPFIVKQSNGKEIAVILMDTQGVFDEFANQRDWSTIVGISLLSSSCLIFNVFTNLQEDILMVLESFLQYGLLAAQTNGSEAETPFQNLMFLIRDWNIPAQYKYGKTGGKQFLKRKLEIKPDQSLSSQTARSLIERCFKEVNCFLMPDPGDKAKEDLNFNGSVSYLSPRFVEKMKEFIIYLLNPEELEPKIINNSYITASELFQYLKEYVGIFNSDELPKPVDIVEATAKVADLIQINKLKDSYLNELKTYSQTKSFIPRKQLGIHNNDLRVKTINKFNSTKKTKNNDIEKELNAILEENLLSIYEQIYNENEKRRDRILTETIEKCSSNYLNNMAGKLDSTFVEPLVLDEILRKEKKKINDDFSMVFGEEDQNLFAPFSLNLAKFIESSETAFRSENYRRIAEAENNNSNAVNDSIESCRKAMRSALDENIFLTEELFSRYEDEIEKNAKKLFKDKCIFGDSKFIKRFESEFEYKLTEEKKEFKSLNRNKMDKTISDTDMELNKSLTNYNEEMRQILGTIVSEEQLIETHENMKSKILNQLMDNCVYKDENFLKLYLEKFIKETNLALSDLKSKLHEQTEKVKTTLKNAVTKSKTLYLKDMENLFTNGEKFYSDEDLSSLHEDFKKKAILNFGSVPNPGFNIEVEEYISELEVLISEEFNKIKRNNKLRRDLEDQNLESLTNDFLTKYEEQMEKILESVDSDSELLEKHNEVKDEIMKTFKALNPIPGSSSFDAHSFKLEGMITDSFDDSIIKLFKLESKNKESLTKTLISEARKFYREQMNKYYQKTSFISSSKLQQFNDSEVDRTIKKFENERGNMPFDKYKKLIIDSLKDIYDKIEEENDMNAPTLPAIGIDLGTTNSCVAYFKPGRSSGTIIVIPNELGNNTTASAVAFNDGGEIVGDVAKEDAYYNPRNTIFLAKRLIGREFSDTSVQNDLKLWSCKVVDDGSNNPKFSVRVNGKDETYFPEQISAKVLKKMKQIAETHLGCKVKNAVITVPAYFNDSQKEATKDAGAIAGLNVLKIINEPTAAAIAFKLNRNDDRESRKVLIYDFGGGTFDVAVLVIDGGNVDIKAVGGDNHLGGDDFDTNVVKYCLDEFYRQTGLKIQKNTFEGEKALRRLRTRCEEQKCKLSSVNSTTISIDNFFESEDLSVVLTRDKFEQLNNSLFIKSMDLVQQALHDAGVDNSEIDDIVLVGGSTRIPRVQEMLSDLFDGKALNHAINPDEAVAVGAAIQAAILNGNQAQGLGQLKVSDVAPMSLGVKVVGGFMSTIVPRNSKVPNKYMKQYETTSDYQTSVDIEIYEGEEEMAESNRLLGKFSLNGIPSAPRGEQPINVTLEINDEGILHVNAKIVSTGGEEEIEIKEHKGRLTNQELETLIEGVFKYQLLYNDSL